MTREDVLLYQEGDENKWKVECTFIFSNSGKETDVLMGFPDSPERQDEEDSTWYDKGKITDFYCEVDGEEIDWEVKSGTKNPSDPSLEKYQRVYVWPVRFRAGQKRIVKNRYSIETSWDSYWGSVYYILKTGALWKGTIGEGTVKIVPFGGRFVPEFSSINPKWYKIKSDTVIWHFKKLEPEEDIWFSYDATSQGWYCRAKEALSTRSPQEVKECLHHFVRSFQTGELSSVQYYLNNNSECVIDLADSLFWLYRELAPDSYLILPVAYHLSLAGLCDTLANDVYLKLKEGTIDDSVNYRFVAINVCAEYLEKYSLARQILREFYRDKLSEAQSNEDMTVYDALERLRKSDLDSIKADSVRHNAPPVPVNNPTVDKAKQGFGAAIANHFKANWRSYLDTIAVLSILLLVLGVPVAVIYVIYRLVQKQKK